MKKWFPILALVLVSSLVWAKETKTKAPAAKAKEAYIQAMCTLSPASGSEVKGWVKFTQKDGYVLVQGEITGLKKGKHGFHVHEKGDCSAADAASAGGHFNPTHAEHGSPKSSMRHVGDLGNINADKNGKAKFNFKDKVLRLTGENSIIGKSLILHADKDDLKSQPAGNAGKRVACGVIQETK